MTRYVLTVLLLATGMAASAQQIQVSKENKTIAITTNDEAGALADTATITIGFHSYGKDQDGTYADATKVSNAIMAAVGAAGVKPDAIQSADQKLSPLEPHSDNDLRHYNQGLRFEFEQAWHVTVPAADAAKVLHAAVLAGANESGNIDWSLKDTDALEAEAARKALEQARKIAERMAAGLGTKLGPLVYASNQTPPRGLAALLGGALNTETATISATASKPNLKPLAISPERITKSATVYAVFSIE